jgi:hypothetical protein
MHTPLRLRQHGISISSVVGFHSASEKHQQQKEGDVPLIKPCARRAQEHRAKEDEVPLRAITPEPAHTPYQITGV